MATRSSRPPRSSPAAGSSRMQQLGVGHQGARDLHPLALPLAQGAEGAVEQVHRRRPRRAGPWRGRGRARRTAHASARPRRTTPRPPRRGRARARDPLGDGGAGPADARPQLEDVDRADDLAEDPDHAGGRVDLRRAQLHQRGLAGAVGSEDDPALVLLDHPVDSVEQGRLASLDGDVGELEYGVHETGPQRRLGVRCLSCANLPGRVHQATSRLHGVSSLPMSALLATWLDAVRVGRAGPDDLADAVRGGDPRHLVVGLPVRQSVGQSAQVEAETVLDLHELPSAASARLRWPCRRPATRSASVVHPSSTSLRSRPARRSSSGAVGLVPEVDARTVVWQAYPANPVPWVGRARDRDRAAHHPDRGHPEPRRPRRRLLAARDPRPAAEPAPPAGAALAAGHGRPPRRDGGAGHPVSRDRRPRQVGRRRQR